MDEKKIVQKDSLLSKWKARKKVGTTTTQSGINKRPTSETPKPSSAQLRLWLLQQRYPNNTFYQYAHLYKINGALNIDVLTKCFEKLIQKHEILRTNFIADRGEVILHIHAQINFSIKVEDVTGIESDQQNELAENIVAQEKDQLFDLARDPLIRICIIKLSDTEHWMIFSMHHIIGDRQSLEIIQDEIFQDYQTIQERKVLKDSNLDIQFSDFAHWQRSQKINHINLNYWKNKLAGNLPILDLTHDHKRPAKQTFNGALVSTVVEPDISMGLAKLSKEKNVTMYVILLAAFKVLLHRFTKQTDILVGSPFSTRDKTSLEKLIGFFQETIVLRSDVKSEFSFLELLQQVKEITLEAFQHRNMPFEEVVKIIQPERLENVHPLFQAMFLYNKISNQALDVSSLEIEDEMLDLGHSKFDVTLFAKEIEKKESIALEFSLEFASGIINKSSAHRLLHHLKVLLKSIINNPTEKIGKLTLLNDTDKYQILGEWNKTEWALPNYNSVVHLINEHANQSPDSIAVTYQSDQLTYQQLNERSNLLASELIKLGLQTNDFVGLYIGRSTDMIVGILGILKAGGAYVPLDPDYPRDRIAYMLNDSGAKYVITNSELDNQLDHFQGKIISIDQIHSSSMESTTLPELQIYASNIAYLIYTSGSTGEPKGVPISHSNLLHSTLARYSFYPENPSAFLLLSSFSFDSSVAGIFWTICSGGKLVIPIKRIEQDIELLSTIIKEEEVSHTLMLPSLYSALLSLADSQKFISLKNIMVAGEACPGELVQKHYNSIPNASLYNEYGPTEASVWCVAHLTKVNEPIPIPIGRPIPNTSAFVLDEYLEPVPIGVSGELYIGGKGVARGYFERPELTAERFITVPPNIKPYKNYEVFYKTGDLVRYRENGIIDFIGRVDQQIKIRGFRVELEEIEKVIKAHIGVLESVIDVDGLESNGQTSLQLIAYIKRNGKEDLDNLNKYLIEKLPPYMVPSKYLIIDQFPTLPNGKIDRIKLPKVDDENVVEHISKAAPTSYEGPSTKPEIILQKIWQNILQIDEISINDNFFSIGGDSLLSIQIVAKAKEAELNLAPNQLFKYQTIKELAASIEQVEENNIIEIEPVLEYPLSELQKAFLFNSHNKDGDQGRLELEFILEGKLDIEVFKNAWQLSAARHDSMRMYIANGKAIVATKIELLWNQVEPKLDLHSPSNSFLQIELINDDKHRLTWICHHIFLDGWSCGVILKDAMNYYQSILHHSNPSLKEIPGFLSFQKWRDEKDKSIEKNFWVKQLSGFNQPLLFNRDDAFVPEVRKSNELIADQITNVNQSIVQEIANFCQTKQITPGTLYQSAWAIMLACIFNKKDIVFGATVSGRFIDFPLISEMSGLFMNVQPNRFSINPNLTVTDWLKEMNKQQGSRSQHEETQLQEIQSYLNWPVQVPLFDTLFVYGNFLKDGLEVGDLKVTHFEGGFSSTYPLTIRINPLQNLEITWRYKRDYFTDSDVKKIAIAYKVLLHEMINSGANKKVSSLLSTKIEQVEFKLRKQEVDRTILFEHKKTTVEDDATNLEVMLQSLWIQVFQIEEITSDDNFFDLGGNSIMALQLFSKLETQTRLIIPPATLFKHPTIKELIQYLEERGDEENKNNVVVPLRKKGYKTPLFCLHGGGGHVFFYRSLAKHLDPEIPVYTLQPVGLGGKEKMHESISEMAQHYLNEIKKIQPTGPYQILGTCFSNAVALEIGHQLIDNQEEISLLAIIDSGPLHLFGESTSGKSSTVSKFVDMLKRGDFSNIRKKIISRLQPTRTLNMDQEVENTESGKQLKRTIESLNDMYANYHWKPINTNIQLIRSSEFNNRTDKKYHISQWKKLAKAGLQIEVVSGHHKTIFDEPEVVGLANKLSAIINDF